MKHLLIAASLAMATSAALAQQDFSKVTITPQKVAGTVYMLTGAGGNIGVSIGEDGVVIVDDQFAPLAPKIIEALDGITTKPIKFVLNTHYHGDHTGGNEVFGRTAPIIAHENVRKRMASGSSAGGRTTPPARPSALPIVTFNDRVTIHVNGEDIRAVHLPSGHTDGDAVIFFTQSDVVHMGDDFFNGMFPFVDQANGGSVRGMLTAVEKVIAIVPDDVKVIPGHGALSDKAGLRKFAEMLRATIAAVDAAAKSGKTLEQMKADKILAAWDSWASSFITTDTYLGFIYDDPARK